MALGGVLAVGDRRYRIHSRKNAPADADVQMPLKEKTA